MNQPHDQSPRDPSEPPFIRPGTRSPADEPGDVPEPLAPFFGGLHEIEIGEEDDAPIGGSGPAAETAGAVGEDAADEMPWLVREDRDPVGPPAAAPTSFDAPSYLGGVPEVDIDSDGDIVSFDELSPSPPAAPIEEEAGPSARGAATEASRHDDGGWHPSFPADDPAERDAARELHVEQAGGFREAGSVLAEEVAVRLERIAHSLRSTTPAELLAGSGDPLEILIVGYVLGASRGRPEHTGDQASTI